MAFNLGAGLAAAGQTIASQAGAEALEMQKSDLESQRDQLAAQTAHGLKTEEMGTQAGYEATAASKLADVNAAAADVQDKFQTGLTKLQGANSMAVAKVGAGAEIGAANIQANASMANIRAQLAQGDIQVTPDGTLMSVDKTTHKATPVIGDDGQPIKGVVPGQAALVRDAVNATNEQLRALTIRYDQELKGPQAALDNLLKTNTSATDPDVMAARQSVQDVKTEYKPAFDHLNQNMDSYVSSITSGANLPASAPANKSGASASDFYRTKPNPPTDQSIIAPSTPAAAPAAPPAKKGIVSNPDHFTPPYQMLNTPVMQRWRAAEDAAGRAAAVGKNGAPAAAAVSAGQAAFAKKYPPPTDPDDPRTFK